MAALNLTTDHGPGHDVARLSAFERRLLDEYQRDFPLLPRPYAEIARQLGVREAEVIAALERLQQAGLISRVGAVVTPHKAGWSTLAAMAVPAGRLEQVAALVSSYPEVNHNYEREHRLNLWFVVAAADKAQVRAVLKAIAGKTDLEVLDLPLVEAYRLDLGFPLSWD
jgi:DNA-binding Lrp family transcriptional regulator